MSLEQIRSKTCRINLRNAILAIDKGDSYNACVHMLAAYEHAFSVIKPKKISDFTVDRAALIYMNDLNCRISLVSYGIKISEYDFFRGTVEDLLRNKENVNNSQQFSPLVLQKSFRFVLSAIAAIETDNDID